MTRQRVKNRRPQLVRIAAEQFWERGYQGTTMADIARACGITAGAVYRHVPDKETLLVEAIREMVHAAYAAAQVAVDGAADAPDALQRLAAALAENAVDRPAVVGLWHRESRYLPRQVRDELVGLRTKQVMLWDVPLAQLRPELNPVERELRIRAAFGLLNSVPILPAGLSRETRVATLGAAVHALVRSGREYEPVPDTLAPTGLPRGSGRLEQLLDAATELFGRSGYRGASVGDIAAAVGMRGPSIYEYVSSKEDLLGKILDRVAAEFDHACRVPVAADGPPAFVQLMDRYIGFALFHRDDLSLYATERHHLTEALDRDIEKRRQERLRVLVEAAAALRPDLSERAVTVLTAAAVEAVWAVARSARFRSVDELPRLLTPLVVSVLADARLS